MYLSPSRSQNSDQVLARQTEATMLSVMRAKRAQCWFSDRPSTRELAVDALTHVGEPTPTSGSGRGSSAPLGARRGRPAAGRRGDVVAAEAPWGQAPWWRISCAAADLPGVDLHERRRRQRAPLGLSSSSGGGGNGLHGAEVHGGESAPDLRSLSAAQHQGYSLFSEEVPPLDLTEILAYLVRQYGPF